MVPHTKDIDQMLLEIAKGRVPKKIMEEFMENLKEFDEKKDRVLDQLMNLYANLEHEDAQEFSKVMERYFMDEEAYSLKSAVRDLMCARITRKFNHQLAHLVQENEFDLS
jgi:HEPN domain-containing protein